MSSRVVSTGLSMRIVTRTTSIASSRGSRSSQLGHVNSNATAFAILDESRTGSREKTVSSKPPYCDSISSGDVLTKVFEEDKKRNQPCQARVFDEHQGKITHAWEPTEKELWLERFGGPGKTAEKAVGKGAVVLREVGTDGKGYLRVLI